MKKNWWKEAVAYQIYPKSFKDSNNDGIGDLKGIVEKIPYLKELGVDIIWVSPFYPSPMHDNGYDIVNYYAIDPMFGTMEDMDLLLETAKNADIKVLSDMVLNHTSNEHPWFLSAINDKNSKYRDYYIFKEAEDKQPTNGRSIFGGSVWEKTQDGSYYYHTFDKTQPDLNWENKEMRQEIYDMMNFWLDKGISGFRMDAITYIKKDQSFKSIEPDGDDGLAEGAYLSLNQEGINDLLSELKRETYGKRQAVTVAEAPGVAYSQLGQYIGDDGHFSMIFDFSYTDIDLLPGGRWYQKFNWTIKDLKEALFNSQLCTQDTGWGAVYLENHDQPRSINKYFRELAESKEYHYEMGTVLATLYFLLRGTPFIYQGQEIGMSNCHFDNIEEYDDVNTKDQYNRAIAAGYHNDQAMNFAFERSRDNSRLPIQWDSSSNAGFSDHKPWLKVDPNYVNVNVSQQMASERSIFHYYQELIKLRKNPLYKETLVYGRIKEVETSSNSVIAYERISKDQQTIMVVVNLAKEPACIRLDQQNCLLSNYEKGPVCNGDGEIRLRAYEGGVFLI